MSGTLTKALSALLALVGAGTVLTAYLIAPLTIAINDLVVSGAVALVAAGGLVAMLAALVLFVLVKTTRKQMEPSRERPNERFSERLPVDFEIGLNDDQRGRALDLSVGGLAVVIDEENWADADAGGLVRVTGIPAEGELLARIARSEPIFCGGRRQRLLGLATVGQSSRALDPEEGLADAVTATEQP